MTIKKLNISKLYRPGFEFKRNSIVNTGGLASKTEQLIASVSGRMRPLSGDEILSAEKKQYVATHRFYCDVIEVSESDFIYDSVKNLTYEIRSIVNPMEMDKFLQMDCELKR